VSPEQVQQARDSIDRIKRERAEHINGNCKCKNSGACHLKQADFTNAIHNILKRITHE
jgi:hypothetical protein